VAEQRVRRLRKPEGAAQPGEASPALVAARHLERRRAHRTPGEEGARRRVEALVERETHAARTLTDSHRTLNARPKDRRGDEAQPCVPLGETHREGQRALRVKARAVALNPYGARRRGNETLESRSTRREAASARAPAGDREILRRGQRLAGICSITVMTRAT